MNNLFNHILRNCKRDEQNDDYVPMKTRSFFRPIPKRMTSKKAWKKRGKTRR